MSEQQRPTAFEISQREEARIRSTVYSDEGSLTAEQRAQASNVLTDGQTELNSETHAWQSHSLRIATADEMQEGEKYGQRGIAQNDPSIAYPVAILETVTVEHPEPSSADVKHVSEGVMRAIDGALYATVNARVGRDWTGDVDPLSSVRLTDAVESIARQLLENGLRPMEHRCVSLIDADGEFLASWER